MHNVGGGCTCKPGMADKSTCESGMADESTCTPGMADKPWCLGFRVQGDGFRV